VPFLLPTAYLPTAQKARVAFRAAAPYKPARVSNRPASLEGMPWRFLMLHEGKAKCPR
jgi:hypothetical protein